MSEFIKETSGTSLNEYLLNDDSVYLRTGRSNVVEINGESRLHDVRAMHIFKNENSIAPNVEFVLQKEEEQDSIHITFENVYSAKVTWMGWSKKLYFTPRERIEKIIVEHKLDFEIVDFDVRDGVYSIQVLNTTQEDEVFELDKDIFIEHISKYVNGKIETYTSTDDEDVKMIRFKGKDDEYWALP